MKFKEILQESAGTYLHARYSPIPGNGDQYTITKPASSEHEALVNAHVSHGIFFWFPISISG